MLSIFFLCHWLFVQALVFTDKNKQMPEKISWDKDGSLFVPTISDKV